MVRVDWALDLVSVNDKTMVMVNYGDEVDTVSYYNRGVYFVPLNSIPILVHWWILHKDSATTPPWQDEGGGGKITTFAKMALKNDIKCIFRPLVHIWTNLSLSKIYLVSCTGPVGRISEFQREELDR